MHDKEQKLQYKYRLKQVCSSIIEQRITAAKSAIESAQQSANQEEKSSAGDKYETSRAMGHLEKDMHSRQLAAQLKELATLHSINTDIIYTTAVAGSFIECDQISFFIACGLGKQLIDGRVIIFLSPQAPLAQSLISKNKNDTFKFNGVEKTITELY